MGPLPIATARTACEIHREEDGEIEAEAGEFTVQAGGRR